jgi:hypothetical protein
MIGRYEASSYTYYIRNFEQATLSQVFRSTTYDRNKVKYLHIFGENITSISPDILSALLQNFPALIIIENNERVIIYNVSDNFYLISISPITNGSVDIISPSNSNRISKTQIDDISFEAVPASNAYKVSSVSINNGEVAFSNNNNIYTIPSNNINDDIIISASFELNTFDFINNLNISSINSNNGYVDIVGGVTNDEVTYGIPVSFRIIPAVGYEYIDGLSVSSGNSNISSITFQNGIGTIPANKINDDITINSANFALANYSVTYDVANGQSALGSVSKTYPASSTVQYNVANIVFEVSPKTNYELDPINTICKIGEINYPLEGKISANTITIPKEDIIDNIVLTVFFQGISFEVNVITPQNLGTAVISQASTGAGTNSGTIRYNSGSFVCQVTPDPHYVIDNASSQTVYRLQEWSSNYSDVPFSWINGNTITIPQEIFTDNLELYVRFKVATYNISVAISSIQSSFGNIYIKTASTGINSTTGTISTIANVVFEYELVQPQYWDYELDFDNTICTIGGQSYMLTASNILNKTITIPSISIVGDISLVASFKRKLIPITINYIGSSNASMGSVEFSQIVPGETPNNSGNYFSYLQIGDITFDIVANNGFVFDASNSFINIGADSYPISAFVASGVSPVYQISNSWITIPITINLKFNSSP